MDEETAESLGSRQISACICRFRSVTPLAQLAGLKGVYLDQVGRQSLHCHFQGRAGSPVNRMQPSNVSERRTEFSSNHSVENGSDFFTVEVVRLPYRSPNLKAHAERFVGSIRDEGLSRNEFLRRTIAAKGHSQVRRSLSSGAESPGDRQSVDRTGRTRQIAIQRH